MAKTIAIFYGSSAGHTRRAAQRISEALGSTAVFNVGETAPSKVGEYDVLILGTSTWGNGDMQHDWEDFIVGLRELDLKDKTVAVFGCGDTSMRDTFCGAAGMLYHELQGTGARFVGAFGTEGYDFDREKSNVLLPDGRAVGLLLDDVQHPLMTPDRIDAWTKQLKTEI